MNYSYNSINREAISVEANSDNYLNVADSFDSLPDLDLDSLFSPFMSIDGSCDPTKLAQSINPPVDSFLFEQSLGFTPLTNTVWDVDSNQLALNDLPLHPIGKPKKTKLNKKIIPLSTSVAIGTPQRTLYGSHKIEVMYELEKTYRPRYKSDYFALSGHTRKPRYVTDRHNNHYISLRVPMGIRGKIRIDWLTVPDENGNRFTMPYRFQTDNNSSEVEDTNPIYENIAPNNTEGILKLYLVLIKTKQDGLKKLQPLKPFHPLHDLLGMFDKEKVEKTIILSPKKLIQKYQLGKSQLAFTLCSLNNDGQSYTAEWDTTVYSTVIEEESNENPPAKSIVSCPNCSTEINIDDDIVLINNNDTGKRKSLPIMGQKPRTLKKQKSLNSKMFYFE